MPTRLEGDVILAADVGGTQTRVGLFRPGPRRPGIIGVAEYVSARYDGLAAILEAFLKERPQKVATAVVAVAGPVIDGRSQVTNLPWRISAAALKNRFGWPQFSLINDLAAMATALPYLQSRETVALNTKRRQTGRNLALIAPGTGLGIALLVAGPDGYRVVASEGGHVDWAPLTDQDLDLWRFLQRRYGHVSAERIGAGGGLSNIYDWLALKEKHTPLPGLAAIPPQDRPQAIARGALEQKDPFCQAALETFVRLLGAQAGNLVLTGMATGGLFLGGGIPPKILPALQQPIFMEAFRDKGRFQALMAQIPVRVITHPRAGLLGAAIHGFQTRHRALS